MPARVIGIISIKGGVGKTTIVSNLGLVMARDLNKRVLLVDSNLSAPNLGLHFGMVDIELGIHEVLVGDVKPENAIYEHSPRLHIMPASIPPKEVDNILKLKDVIESLKGKYDVILLDSSPNASDEMVVSILSSDDLYVVTTPDYPSLSATLHAIKLAKEKNAPIRGLILNKVYGKKYELSIEDIEEASNCPVIAIINHDVDFIKSLALTQPLANIKEKDVVYEYRHLAAAMLGVDFQDKRLKTKLNKLLKGNKPTKIEINRVLLKNTIRDEMDFNKEYKV